MLWCCTDVHDGSPVDWIIHFFLTWQWQVISVHLRSFHLMTVMIHSCLDPFINTLNPQYAPIHCATPPAFIYTVIHTPRYMWDCHCELLRVTSCIWIEQKKHWYITLFFSISVCDSVVLWCPLQLQYALYWFVYNRGLFLVGGFNSWREFFFLFFF